MVCEAAASLAPWGGMSYSTSSPVWAPPELYPRGAEVELELVDRVLVGRAAGALPAGRRLGHSVTIPVSTAPGATPVRKRGQEMMVQRARAGIAGLGFIRWYRYGATPGVGVRGGGRGRAVAGR